ncbi:Sec63 domain, partial [Dillenia turbinata]
MDSYALRSVSDLPAPFRSTFSFRYFNSLQSECYPACFLSDINMVISAPTGSGKTVLFELCILRLLSRFISEGRFNHAKGTLKTIYIAPSKALVQEKLRDWNQKLGSWGVGCLELTGDNEFYNIKNIQEADIILTTPEKFDAVTRYRIKDGGLSFFSDISLVLIDEVHLLNEPRGAALEAIVSRIKTLARKSEMNSNPISSVRFLAISATIPNIEDIAEWLSVPVEGIKRFGEEMRPVKLTTKVFGYTPAKNDFLFEKRLQNYIFDILMQYSRGKSALVFCSTRKGAQEAAQKLSQTVMTFGYSNPFVKDKDQQERLREASLSCGDKQMQSYILYGVGYHNGGLSLRDRNLIEGLFLKGDIQVLCTTNTLAHGINLPAHTVIIKSTQYFNKGKGLYMEYDRSMILQMCGRAGRPPFDDTGMVIIMTRRETVYLYENLLNGCEVVESQLLSCMTEHLTAEIVQLTVSDITRAIEWMKCSYLYVRMKKNPEHYAVKKGIPRDHLEKHMQELCLQKVNELSRYQMIWTDEYGFLLKPLEPGRLMTKYYLKFNTMKHIIQSPENCSIEDAIHVISHADEISWIQLRRNEKKLLSDINTDKDGRLQFHVLADKGKKKKRIQTREEKIFVLTNDCLTGDPAVRELSLNQALHSMGISSFDALAEADPRKIEIATGRKYPFGNHIKESLRSLPPKVEMKVEEVECQRQGKSKILLTLTRLSQPIQSTRRHYADMIVGSEEDNLIHYHEKIRLEEFSSPYSTTILFSRPRQGKLTVKVDLIFKEYIGIDFSQKIFIKTEDESGKRKASSFQTKDFGVVEDDNDRICQPPTEEKAQRDMDSIPSFNLLEEELGEGISNEIVTEDGQAVETDEDDCKIISEKTVFDHIRRKAKNFPVLASLDIPASPSSQATVLTRKRTREKLLEGHNSTKILEETRKHGESPGKVVAPMLDLGMIEIEWSFNTQGTLTDDPKESISKSLTEAGIFDHIRNKAKNYPVLNKTKTIDSECSVLTEEQFYGNVMDDFSSADFDILNEASSNKMPRNTSMSNLEAKESEHVAFTAKQEPKTQHLANSINDFNVNLSEVPCLANFSARKEARLFDPGSSTEGSKKQQGYSSRSNTQCGSLAVASAEIRE